MRISDWSSDVCSSDLLQQGAGALLDLLPVKPGTDRAGLPRGDPAVRHSYLRRWGGLLRETSSFRGDRGRLGEILRGEEAFSRSEERRGGEEGVSPCRSRV